MAADIRVRGGASVVHSGEDVGELGSRRKRRQAGERQARPETTDGDRGGAWAAQARVGRK
jgi:hypothetical protein